MVIRRLLYYLRSIFTLLIGIANWPTVIAAFIGLPLRKPFRIRLRKLGYIFQVRNPMDVWIIKETCLDRDYEQVGVPVQDGWKVIDIGAGLGDFAIDAARRHPSSAVHAYEPFPESFALLQANLALNKTRNVTAFQEAVGAVSGVTRLDISQIDSVRHSTMQRSTRTIEVPSVTLQEVLLRLPGAQCDLLKLDCEGAEYCILCEASPETLRRIQRIVMEYHDNVTELSHHNLIAFLERQQFKVNCYPSRVRKDIGLLYATRG
ncbi:MAG TPA: FkbM family methyltransferase [Abditibacteriaceae bacterium]|nr:FkbM family methyltransferase [Abditibacteriaceae bacterium]